MRLAVVGDIHSYRLRVPVWQLLGKRLVGLTSLLVHRQFRFDLRLLRPVLQRARAIRPDWLLLPGDLTSTALESEFAAVAAELRSVVDAVPTLIVPGNHDRYTHRSRRYKVMERCLGPLVPGRFPDLRGLGPGWRLLALDAAWPHFWNANGRIGPQQLAQAGRMVEGLTARDGLVVLCHYPLFVPAGTRSQRGHRLRDLAELQALLLSCPARQVYVHGHVHQPWAYHPAEAGAGRILVVNAGSPTMVTSRQPWGQGLWELELPAAADGVVSAWRHVPASEAAVRCGDAQSPGDGDGWAVTRVV